MAFKIDQPVKGSSGGSSGGGGFFGGKGAPTKPTPRQNAASTARYARPAPPTPRQNAASTARYARGSSGGGGSSGGRSNTIYSVGGGGFGGGGGGLSVDSGIPSKEDYLKGDDVYQAAVAALAKQLSNFNTDIDSQLANRKLDYSKALQQLGYVLPTEEGAEGSWLWEDQTTAAGRAYRALINDFASRGMIQSSAYGESQNDLTRTLNDQFKGLETSNEQFINDLTRQKAKAEEENTAALQAARAEAILRRAAQYGFGV